MKNLILAGVLVILAVASFRADFADTPAAGPAPVQELIITSDTKVDRNVVLNARLIVRASHITIDGNGATLTGPGKAGDLKSFETAGAGIQADGCTNVSLRNLRVSGFAVGLAASNAQGWQVENCDFSDNYHNPAHGWGDLPPRGGIVLRHVSHSVFRKNKARNVWDGIHLIDCSENLVADNDFSHCSNTCAKLGTSCRNRFLNNNLSYGIRIDRSKGEVHARDSTGVLIESGSDDNYWFGNDVTHGGDGIFIRVLNGWVSRGNLFVENDTSHANNNCVESWSPGNTFIRNKANHGSYGFWLGGSDQTRLLGNEAAYNGLPDGYHNAPEPGFGHGGIVFVSGSSSHTVVDGNHCHHNNGAGIVFRGDAPSKGKAWRSHHWIIQNNHLHDNHWAVWGAWGDWIHLANNRCENNTENNRLDDLTNLVQARADRSVKRAPVVEVQAPDRAVVGRPVLFDASASTDPAGLPLSLRWDLGGVTVDRPAVEHTFAKPGFYRVGVTVSNGTLADMAFRDLVVTGEVNNELGTEGQASQWGYELENNTDGKGKMHFADDADAVVGKCSLRFRPDPYPGDYARAIYPRSRDANWNLTGKQKLSFWLKTRNRNNPGFQNAGPVVTLYGRDGTLVYKPVKEGNVLVSLPYSEARWTWLRLEIPLGGDNQWSRIHKGQVKMDRIDALSIALDSWGYEPFTVWIDGLGFE